MRVISASRRTDVPAFYSRWLLNRLRAGYCHWLSPFGGRVYRVSLRPEDCLAIVFWTRDPRPLLRRLDELAAYHFYFHFTICGYPREVESHSPPEDVAVAAFRDLARAVGPDRVFWRYDPIVVGDGICPAAEHVARFERLADALAGSTGRCYFSFLDRYGKTTRNLARVERRLGVTFAEPSPAERLDLVARLNAIAGERGIRLFSCCERDLALPGVERAHCVDADVIRMLRPDAGLALRAAPTRPGCGCCESVDVGAYDTCAFGCAYCYATHSRAVALRRLREHDPDDSILWRPPALRGVDLDERAPADLI